MGGGLVVLGSHWEFTRSTAPAAVKPIGAAGITVASTLTVPLVPQSSPASSAILAVVVGAILLMSLAIDGAFARPARRSTCWSLLALGILLAAGICAIGERTSGSSLVLGTGFELAGAGCVLAMLGAIAMLVAAPQGARASTDASGSSVRTSAAITP